MFINDMQGRKFEFKDISDFYLDLLLYHNLKTLLQNNGKNKF